jgi:hypothetical protein
MSEILNRYLGKYVLANNAASGIRFAWTSKEMHSSRSPQIKKEIKAKLCCPCVATQMNDHYSNLLNEPLPEYLGYFHWPYIT